MPTVGDVAIGLHQGTISEEALLGLAPVLLEVAGRGDQVALNLVRRQAQEISLMAVVAMRRLGLPQMATTVVLGGGLLTARNPLLTSEITKSITAAAPPWRPCSSRLSRRSRVRRCWGLITSGRGPVRSGGSAPPTTEGPGLHDLGQFASLMSREGLAGGKSP